MELAEEPEGLPTLFIVATSFLAVFPEPYRLRLGLGRGSSDRWTLPRSVRCTTASIAGCWEPPCRALSEATSSDHSWHGRARAIVVLKIHFPC